MLKTFQCVPLRSAVAPTVLKDNELHALRVPTLFMVGEHEKIYSARKVVARLSKVAPQITAEVIPGAGHDVALVQANMVNRKVLDFLGR